MVNPASFQIFNTGLDRLNFVWNREIDSAKSGMFKKKKKKKYFLYSQS